MKNLARGSVFEHPVHSYIFDTSDPVWRKYFTSEELKEVRSVNKKLLVDIPEELQTFLSSFENTEYTSASHYYDHAMKYKFPLGTSFDKRWVQESIVSACELFNSHHDHLKLGEYSEGNLLHEVWSFVYKLYKDREIVAKLGESCSVATCMAKNNKRSLEAVNPRERKAMGSRIDIVFTADNTELGAWEVGKGNVLVVDDKYLEDGLKKLPKTLRDMLVMQITINPDKANNLCMVGYLMMGLCMELVIVDMPSENLISRVVKSSHLAYPHQD